MDKQSMVLPIAITLVPVALLLPDAARAAEVVELASPNIKDAFAIVQRNGKPYAPFHNNYVAPHAIVENGKLFTAHQDGEGRPIAMAYDMAEKTSAGPARAP